MRLWNWWRTECAGGVRDERLTLLDDMQHLARRMERLEGYAPVEQRRARNIAGRLRAMESRLRAEWRLDDEG